MLPFGQLSASGDPEFGLRLFEEAASGKSALDGDSALLFAYGIYISNGGNPSDFMDLSMEDIQIMFTAYMGAQKRAANNIIGAMIRAMNRNGDING